MRIGIDISSATPGRTGIGTYTYELVRRLVRCRDHDWVLLFNSLRQPPPDLPEFRAPHVKVLRRRLPGPALLKSWQYLDLPDIETLAGGPVDLFHSPSTYIPPQRRGARVTTVHDLYFLEPEANKAPLGGKYLQWVVKRRLPEMHAIITDAASVGRQVVEVLSGTGTPRFSVLDPERSSLSSVAAPASDRPVFPIPLGVDPRFLEPVPAEKLREVRERYQFPEDSSYVMTFGSSAEPRKNTERTTRAVLDSLNAFHRGRCFMLRVGAEMRQFETTTYQLPYVPLEDLPALYRMASALVFPSLHEGFGLPVLEAMACGIPVFTSSTVAVAEFLPPGSVAMCDPTDVEAMTTMLREGFNNPDRLAAMAAAGPEIASRFTWEETARLTLQAYEQTAAAATR